MTFNKLRFAVIVVDQMKRQLFLLSCWSMSLLHSTSRRLRSLFALQPIVPRVAKDIWVGVGSRGWGLGEGVDQLMEVRVRGSERVHKHSPQLFRGRHGTWGFQYEAK